MRTVRKLCAIRATSHRSARAIVAVLAAALGVLTVVGPVAAMPPEQVTIVSHVDFNNPGPNTGNFSITGADGLICRKGTFVDTGIKFSGFQSGKQVQLTVFKDFICDDLSGTFSVKLQIHASFDGTENFTWVIQSGTGAYASLHGSGSGTTVPDAGNPQPGNTNTYTGSIH